MFPVILTDIGSVILSFIRDIEMVRHNKRSVIVRQINFHYISRTWNDGDVFFKIETAASTALALFELGM